MTVKPEARLSESERQLRKQARTGLRAERAVNEPGGRPASVNVPVKGFERK